MNKLIICRILSDRIEEIEKYFREAPIDYGDRKQGFEDLLIGLLTTDEQEPIDAVERENLAGERAREEDEWNE